MESKIQVSENVSSVVKKEKAVVFGIDSGIVTTASIEGVQPSTMFDSINRLQVLNENLTHKKEVHKKEVKYTTFTSIANKINEGVSSFSHRRKREKLQQNDKLQPTKTKQRYQTTRRVRVDQFYKNFT